MGRCESPPGAAVNLEGLRALKESAEQIRNQLEERLQQRTQSVQNSGTPLENDAPSDVSNADKEFVFPISNNESNMAWGDPTKIVGNSGRASTFAVVGPEAGQFFLSDTSSSTEIVLFFSCVGESRNLTGRIIIEGIQNADPILQALRGIPEAADPEFYFTGTGLTGHAFLVSRSTELFSYEGSFEVSVVIDRPSLSQTSFEFLGTSNFGRFEPNEVPRGDGSYVEDTGRPYGPHFRQVLPPGLPLSAPKCATPASSEEFLNTHLEAPLSHFNPDATALEKRAWKAVVHTIALNESGRILNRPVDKFDVRPEVGTPQIEGSNFLDEGVNRKVGRKVIDSRKRPAGTPLYAAYGMFQVTRDTFRTMAVNFNGRLNVSDTWSIEEKWVWEVAPEYQIILPLLQLSKDVWLPSQGMPNYYRGLLSYVSIVGPTWVSLFLTQYNALRQNPPADEDPMPWAAKTTWDSREWIPTPAGDRKNKHLEMMNNVQNKLGSKSHSLSLLKRDREAFNIADKYLPAGV